MLKKTITYTDFNGHEVSDTLYFNLTKIEALEYQPILETQLEQLTAITDKMKDNPDEDVAPADMRDVIGILKEMIRASYGIRSSDGKTFDKSVGVYEDFERSAAFDAFVFGLFENDAAGAFEFMTGIFPAELLEAAGIAKNAAVAELLQPKDDRPAWERENRLPTKGEMVNMDKAELIRAMQKKSQSE